MSIENITAKILQEGQDAADQTQQAAQAQAQTILDQAEKDAQDAIAKMAQKGQEDARLLHQRKVSVAELEARKMNLAAKQQAVQKAFSLALEKLSNMCESEYIAFLAKLISGENYGGGELLLNERDKKAIGPKLVELVNAMDDGKQITLSSQTISCAGGFVLKQGDVELNSTLETIVDSVKEELTPVVVQTLFS